MGIQVEWKNDAHTVIRVCYDRFWTWTDFARAKIEIDALLHSVDYTVDILSDSSKSGGLPGGNALTVLANSFQTAPANIGQVVVLGANPFFRALLQILQTVSLNHAAKRIRFVKSLEAAEELLQPPAPQS